MRLYGYGTTEKLGTTNGKAKANFEYFSVHNTFKEYNSPTYYGTDLMALSLWRKYASSKQMQKWGAKMEARLWKDIARFYHAGMKNMSGPFVRSYGMDMTKYCALTGLWIALAIDDPSLAPWPVTGGRGQDERSYGPIFALLGSNVPKKVMPSLLKFTGPRTFKRKFVGAKASVLVEENLMIGAAAIRKRKDEQQHPGTIYWLAEPDQPASWILLSGINDVLRPSVSERGLKICQNHKPVLPVRFLIYSPNLDENSIKEKNWSLPNLNVEVEIAESVTLKQVSWINHRRFGRCLEVLYNVEKAFPKKEAILWLRPQK